MIVNMIKKNRILINPDIDFYSIIKKFLTESYNENTITDIEIVFNDFLKRESEGSFELLPHIVIPHLRSKNIKELTLFIAVSKKGIPYKNAKSGKVNIIFFVLIPDEDTNYIKLLASISRFIKNESFVKELIDAKLFDDVVYTFKKYSLDIIKKEKKGVEKYLVILSLNKNVDDVFIPTTLAEVGVSLSIAFDGKNMGNISTFLPFLSSFFISTKITKYNKTYIGITDEPEAGAKIYTILKNNKIDIEKNGVGFIATIKINEWYGGYSGIDF
ncbi:MAG TPA: PTS sugar transporter subunit IIA [Spirochaetota bacterium]|nr:PTS sugar transporter subunit IIA [Spirochaetota bacterium]HOM37631.1 PTS sugar transporter subunit IIA [Spirochaetota bacterium]HPQ49398.1 PTS sugar transporter subunit IIA [Spirochaetota bacterium]